MDTEELNDFIFADLVHQRVRKLWLQDCDSLMQQGLTTDEAITKNPAQETYISQAIIDLIEFRQKFFAAPTE